MALSSDLLSQFAKVTKDNTKDKNKESTTYGTIVKYGDTMYAKLDGSDLLTPVSTTTEFKTGERVVVSLKNHSAVVTGNTTSPSARTGTVQEIGDRVSEFQTILADKVDVTQLDAEVARIDKLYADNVVIGEKLTAAEADIDNLEADNVTINGKLTAQEAKITSIEAESVTINGKITANEAKITTLESDNATINGKLTAVETDIDNLEADNATINGKLTAHEASINDLAANKLSAKDADLKYANIDFSNIKMAAIETFFSKSGIIKDMVVGEQTITGELVGVTIKGDLIEGNTVVADKLVVKGDDGLYYKLNTDGVTTEAEQTDYNSLNGSIIRAQSVTADKIAVTDLVAFDATIAGFKITDSALYSGSKESVDNITRGIYLGKDGQVAFGDGNSYLKYYKDTDGNYKLAISAESFTFTTGKSINDVIDEKVSDIKSVDTTVVEYQAGSSGTTAPTGTWSVGIPTVPSGQYLWTRTTITYNDGTDTILYSVSSKGDKGADGKTPVKGTDYFTTSEINSITNNASQTATTNATNNVKPIAEAAAKTATNYMRFEDGTGLVIGDMAASTLGNNVCIDSDSVDIRKGSKVVATFAEETTIGDTSGRNVVINPNGFNMYNGSNLIGQIGYGDGLDSDGNINKYPYYTLGTRESQFSIGGYSVAEGHGSAQGYISHAEGWSDAQGYASHSEGMGASAIGESSHAEGVGTEATGEGSHAGGYGTIASGDYQTVIGRFNIEDTTSAFIIGNGTGDSTGDSTRSNAFSVDWDGNVKLNGTDLFELIYPVGSIYMSVNDTNPSSLFGGTWVAWGSGRVPVGVNSSDTNFSTVEKTGGASTVTLTTTQIPAHAHGLNNHTHSLNNHTHGVGTLKTDKKGDHAHAIKKSQFSPSGSTSGKFYVNTDSSSFSSTATNTVGGHTHTISGSTAAASGNTGAASGNTANSGGGGAHSNLQPYITCYMWKRTA